MSKIDTIAVLTGDLIRSRAAGAKAVDATFATLAAAAADFGAAWDLDLRFTRFRGDGWQMALQDPGLTLDLILFVLARLQTADIGLRTRVAAGIGAIDSLGTRDLSDASGDAFNISGAALEEMSPKRTLLLAGAQVGSSEKAIIYLCDFIAGGWTRTQAEAVALAIHHRHPTHDVIAGEIGVTRQAAQSRLSGAGFSALEEAMMAFRLHDFTSPTDS